MIKSKGKAINVTMPLETVNKAGTRKRSICHDPSALNTGSPLPFDGIRASTARIATFRSRQNEIKQFNETRSKYIQ